MEATFTAAQIEEFAKKEVERKAKRRQHYAENKERLQANSAAWQRTPSGKASMAKKRKHDKEKAKLLRQAFRASQQATQTAATLAQTPESLEALRQEALSRVQQVQGYSAPAKVRTFTVVVTEQA